VDRIGGLVQRRLDGSPAAPAADELIQVFYPHLRDTVELLQVRRVLRRLNRFMRPVHRGAGSAEADERDIDASRAWQEEREDVPPIEGELESAFPVAPGWLEGELSPADVTLPDWDLQIRHLDVLWSGLCERYPVSVSVAGARYRRAGALPASAMLTLPDMARARQDMDSVRSAGWERMQPFTFGLHSHVAGEESLLACESTVGLVDLGNDAVVDVLMDAIGGVTWKLCVEPRVSKHQDRLFVRRELLFDAGATSVEDAAAMLDDTLGAAVWLHAVLEGADLLGASTG